MSPTLLGTDLFQDAGAPQEVFPSSSWAGATVKVPPHTDIRGQFGSIILPGDAMTCVAAQTSIREEFHRHNQNWTVKPRLAGDITAESPFPYELRTPAEKYKALAEGNLGVGALAVVQWVVGTSDGGEPKYSKPVVLVLGPLIAPTQQSNNVGFDLDELGLSFHTPAQPLGKEWSSKRLYPILSPMIKDSRLKNTDALLEFWDTDLHSIYQLDRGLKACRSIAVMDDQAPADSNDRA